MNDKEDVGSKVQEVIRHLVKTGMANLDKKVLERIAGEKSDTVRAQLDALMSADGCWCPDPPGSCRC